MIKTGGVLLTAFLAASAGLFMQAEEHLRTLTGSCSVAATANEAEVDLRLERDACGGDEHCGSTQAQEPLSAFLGFTLADLRREGAHVDAVIFMPRLAPSPAPGAVHDGRLSGAFRFVPDPAFVERMLQLGFRDLDEEKLQAYTLFQASGLTGSSPCKPRECEQSRFGKISSLLRIFFHAQTPTISCIV